MKLSDLIRKLEDARARYGDLPVFTWDGEITWVRVEPSFDGLAMVSAPNEKPNEIVLEVQTR